MSAPTISRDEIDAAYQAAYDEAYAGAVRSARERHATIINSAEFAGRENAALTLMTESDLPAAQVISLLSAFPKSTPIASGQVTYTGDAVVSSNGDVIANSDAFERGKQISRSLRKG